MATVEGIKSAHMAAVAFHLFTRCAEQTSAFEECVASNSNTSACNEQMKAVAECASALIADASAKAHDEWHHYTSCLDMMSCKYLYCKPEKAAFEQAFPLE